MVECLLTKQKSEDAEDADRKVKLQHCELSCSAVTTRFFTQKSPFLTPYLNPITFSLTFYTY